MPEGWGLSMPALRAEGLETLPTQSQRVLCTCLGVLCTSMLCAGADGTQCSCGDPGYMFPAVGERTSQKLYATLQEGDSVEDAALSF